MAIGEGLGDLEKKGQLGRFIKYYLSEYAKSFDKVLIFSYLDEKGFNLPSNCQIVENDRRLNRFLFSLFLPFIKKSEFQKCDVIRAFHVTGAIPCIIGKIFYGKKFVFNYGYDYPQVAFTSGKVSQGIILPILTKIVAVLADSIIVASGQFSHKFKREKIIYIPNGVDTALFKPEPKRRKNILEALFVGRFEKEKNLEHLIKAVSKFKNIKLTLIGDGSLKQKLVDLKKTTGAKVKFEGVVNNEDLPQYYGNADIFFLTSTTEGSPKALLEAQACGIATIASNIPAIREIIKNDVNGLLCDLSTESIAKAINKLVKQNLFDRLGKEARKNIEKNFNLKKLMAKENKLLLAVAQN